MTAGDSDVTSGSGQSGEERRPTIELGLVVTLLLEAEAVEQLATDIQRDLAERSPDVGWEIAAVRDALVTPPAALAEVVDAARSRLLDEHWDLIVHVTDLPLRISRRPVVARSSRTHGAALVSLPALGLNQSNQWLMEAPARAGGPVRPRHDRHRGVRHPRALHRSLCAQPRDGGPHARSRAPHRAARPTFARRGLCAARPPRQCAGHHCGGRSEGRSRATRRCQDRSSRACTRGFGFGGRTIDPMASTRVGTKALAGCRPVIEAYRNAQ